MKLTKSRVFRWLVLTAAAALAVAGGGLGYIIATTDPPRTDLDAARLALDGARTVEAPRYAKAEIEIAETRYRDGYRAYRRAEARLFGLWDYERVSRMLVEAQSKANEAMEMARRRRDEARARALELIAAAEEGLKAARDGVLRIPDGRSIRARMAQAEVALGESRRQMRAGDYRSAADRASVARLSFESVNRQIDTILAEYTGGSQARRWNRWVGETIEESRRSGGPVIIVDKLNRRCHLYQAGRRVRTYSVDLGASPSKPKLRAGDRATPEGRYRVTQKRGRDQTRYYKALMINYPNEEDRERFIVAKKKGWISRFARLGGLIEIHGDGGRREDWTLGCVALHNKDMDHLFDRVAIGTPVTIVGTIQGE